MKSIANIIGVAFLASIPSAAFCATGMAAPDVTVGRNLQACDHITLPAAAPADGLPLTVTSSDPTKVLLATAPDKPGSASIVITAGRGFSNSPGFCFHALADHGAIPYTVTAPGMAATTGKVTLAGSAVVILGPSRSPSFELFPRTDPMKITLATAALDSSMNILEEQPVAGSSPLTFRVGNSHPAFGELLQSTLTIAPGESMATTAFKPMAEGKSILSPVQPEGFHAPGTMASVEIVVQRPGLALADQLTIGKDLQVLGLICLGAPAGPEGVKVTVKSSDPSKLVLSSAPDKLGSGSVTVTVKPGALTAEYFLQALGDSGTVQQEGTASGYRTRTAQTEIAPSGVIIAYEHYGPPDEAAVLRETGLHEDREFYTTVAVSKQEPVRIVVYTAFLSSGLAADFTVQALRPGVSVAAVLSSSNPAVGTIESPISVPSGSDHGVGVFTPLSTGRTILRLATPNGFSTPKNATAIPANVKQ